MRSPKALLIDVLLGPTTTPAGLATPAGSAPTARVRSTQRNESDSLEPRYVLPPGSFTRTNPGAVDRRRGGAGLPRH
jgi:hypothetical protein